MAFKVPSCSRSRRLPDSFCSRLTNFEDVAVSLSAGHDGCLQPDEPQAPAALTHRLPASLRSG
jgi:hypothetical protein